jgi:hypothetical protein
LSLLSQRAALFASAYSQLANWQRDMVAAGLKHTNTMMQHLTSALERLGALQDCLQLARLAEDARPGDFKAHRAALRVSVNGFSGADSCWQSAGAPLRSSLKGVCSAQQYEVLVQCRQLPADFEHEAFRGWACAEGIGALRASGSQSLTKWQ